MRMTPDGQGRVEVVDLKATDTVQDLLDAVDRYLAAHPTGCKHCEISCCSRPWAVAVEAVAAHRMPAAFGPTQLKLRLNPLRGFRYPVLKKDGSCPHYVGQRCAVYAHRPLICRLYFCHPFGPGYALIREVAAAAYLETHTMECRAVKRPPSPATLRRWRSNPAFGGKDYGAELIALARYAVARRWLEPEEEELLEDLLVEHL